MSVCVYVCMYLYMCTHVCVRARMDCNGSIASLPITKLNIQVNLILIRTMFGRGRMSYSGVERVECIWGKYPTLALSFLLTYILVQLPTYLSYLFLPSTTNMIVVKIASRSGSIRLKSNIFQKEAEADNKNGHFLYRRQILPVCQSENRFVYKQIGIKINV